MEQDQGFDGKILQSSFYQKHQKSSKLRLVPKPTSGSSLQKWRRSNISLLISADQTSKADIMFLKQHCPSNFDETIVHRALQNIARLWTYKSEDKVRSVSRCARKILATLIPFGHVRHIKDFVEADQLLPSELDYRLRLDIRRLEQARNKTHTRLFRETRRKFTNLVYS